MVGELGFLLGVDVPENASHITRRRENSSVIDEATAAEIAGVAGKFGGHPELALPFVPFVYRANVVETTTGDVVSRGSVGARHDP